MTTIRRHLLTIHDDQGDRTVVLDEAAYSLGRDPVNAIVLNGSSISRQHALLVRIPDPEHNGYHYQILDGNASGIRSKNGITIQGESCTTKVLTDGDVIEFGEGVQATYLVQSNPDEEEEPTLSNRYRSIKAQPMDVFSTMKASESDPRPTHPGSIPRLEQKGHPPFFSQLLAWLNRLKNLGTGQRR